VVALLEDERAYWVVLSMATGIGPVRFQRLLEMCGGARGAWQATDLELAAAGLERRTADSLRQLRSRTTPEAVTARLAQLQVRALTLLDEEYPLNRRSTARTFRSRTAGADRCSGHRARRHAARHILRPRGG
jgi:predicted Rossmann fold nucleotide-binding protein DprA/Smf involved in DNA uptake